jgi:hypothetical protein
MTCIVQSGDKMICRGKIRPATLETSRGLLSGVPGCDFGHHREISSSNFFSTTFSLHRCPTGLPREFNGPDSFSFEIPSSAFRELPLVPEDSLVDGFHSYTASAR